MSARAAPDEHACRYVYQEISKHFQREHRDDPPMTRMRTSISSESTDDTNADRRAPGAVDPHERKFSHLLSRATKMAAIIRRAHG
jgi:hypothetical protein